MSQKLAPYVIFPRKIAADYRNGIITKDEFLTYTWIRLNATPYGISITSLSNIKEDLFEKSKTENSINKILLSLKRKEFIFYEKRVGRSGSFEVHLGDFILPKTKVIRTLDKYFKEGLEKNLTPKQSLGPVKQNLNSAETIIKSMTSRYRTVKQNRTYNNDTDKENNKEPEISVINKNEQCAV